MGWKPTGTLSSVSRAKDQEKKPNSQDELVQQKDAGGKWARQTARYLWCIYANARGMRNKQKNLEVLVCKETMTCCYRNCPMIGILTLRGIHCFRISFAEKWGGIALSPMSYSLKNNMHCLELNISSNNVLHLKFEFKKGKRQKKVLKNLLMPQRGCILVHMSLIAVLFFYLNWDSENLGAS